MEQPQIHLEDLEDIKLEVLQEMFNIFDFSNTGHIFTDDLGCILRGLGFNVSEQKISDLINTYDKEGSGRLRFEALYLIIRDNGPFPYILSKEEVIERLEFFDIHRRNKLHSSKLVEILCNMGEGISVEDAKQLLTEIEIDGDNMVDIREFVDYLDNTSLSME